MNPSTVRSERVTASELAKLVSAACKKIAGKTMGQSFKK
jgi:hypothetical protein